MKLEAAPGRVVMKLWNEPSKGKLVLPDNVSVSAFPTYEIVDVGEGKESPYSGKREKIPYKVGNRVIAMSAKCIELQCDGERVFIADWTAIFGKVTD